MGNCKSLSSAAIVPIGQKDLSTFQQVPPNRINNIVEDGEKGVIRVKMVMTKKEAAQLLAQLANNTSLVTAGLAPPRLPRTDDVWRPELESIPEN